ncbi:UvrD-helicase domain-containing protein [Candidatus Parcubacteria bacterium]|nr:UvrD-helicase domain-containing protein [Candidatus Parcubacteria bacterium]
MATEGPVLILAGAGAGKTKTISERIRHLVHSGVAPESILAITFTNKAAKEMRERVERSLASDQDLNRPISMNERPFVSTFHSLGVHILREQAHNAGLRRQFAIFDRDDSKKVVKEALVRVNLDPKVHDPGKIMSLISKQKGRGITVEEWVSMGEEGYFADVVAQVWPHYEQILARDNALDFDDLLLKTNNLLRENKSVRDYYRNVWKFIHIDEYQDTNRVQYEISQLLVGDDRNICVVGDIDQNIYSWRGADIKNIMAFEEDYPNATVITLEENYRSTKTILEAANAVIEKNKVRRKKNLFTSNSSGDKISFKGLLDEVSEANFIASKAKKLIDSGTPAEEMAVLYRANFQSRVLEEAFMNSGVPYQILGTRFFERKEVKDIVSYLRASLNPDCLADMKRIINTPARGIGKTTIVKIFGGGGEELPHAMMSKLANFRALLSKIAETSKQRKVSETIYFIIKESGLEDEFKDGGEDGADRLANAYELVNFAARYDSLNPEDGINQFLTDAALQSDQDELKEDKKAVRLMTVHAAKGLEFDVVFISGLEDGLFPHAKMNTEHLTPGEAEEERRLFYVALTRARKKLILTYAQVRTVFGRQSVSMPSEFIMDIPENLLEEDSYEGYDGESSGRRPLLEIDF